MESVIPTEVRGLIHESQKIQGWVQRLAEHTDEARPEVYEKVLADYEARLADVNDSLAEHRAQLVATVDTRRGELESLRADREEQAADLEEARLRHAVGEYDDKEWGARRDKIQEGLGDLDALLASEEETVGELDDIIASIGSAGPRIESDEVPVGLEGVGEEEHEERAEVAAASAELDEADVEEARVREEAGEEVEIEATAPESELVEAAGAQDAVAEVTEAPLPETTLDEGDGGEYLDELEFLESLSLGDSDRFDAVSAMLDEEEGGKSPD